MKRVLDFLTSKKVGCILIVLFIIMGIFLAKDYGLSTDEPVEHATSIINYRYIHLTIDKVLGGKSPFMSSHVRNIFSGYPELQMHKDRYYGVFMHLPTVAVEHLTGFSMDISDVFHMMHVYNLLVYMGGCLCLFLSIYHRYPKTLYPLAGLLMTLLYPRFFAEGFYNNKDIVFLALIMVSCYLSLRWLEKPSIPMSLLLGCVLAICTNTRILGLAILLLVLAFWALRLIWQKSRHTTPKNFWVPPLLMLLAFICFYTVITPITWSNPLRAYYEIFAEFIQYPWVGKQLYMGELITRDVPWHFLPVWIFITTPVLYLILFLSGLMGIAVSAVKRVKAVVRQPEVRAAAFNSTAVLYDAFYWLCFTLTLGGFILLSIDVYNGWRHAYMLFCPFVYLMLRGFHYAIQLAGRFKKSIMAKRALAGVLAVNLLLQAAWIIRNHPYEYVYFNPMARSFVAGAFDIDYWGVASNDQLRWILAYDDSTDITIGAKKYDQLYMVPQARKRIIRTAAQCFPEYVVADERVTPNWHQPLYEEIHPLSAGGIKINSVFKRLVGDDDFDENPPVQAVETSNGPFEAPLLIDGNAETYWQTPKSQAPGDYLAVEFDYAVDYNLVVFSNVTMEDEFLREPQLFVSSDGVAWEQVTPLWNDSVAFLLPPMEYQWLKVEAGIEFRHAWAVSELRFAHVTPDQMNLELP